MINLFLWNRIFIIPVIGSYLSYVISFFRHITSCIIQSRNRGVIIKPVIRFTTPYGRMGRSHLIICIIVHPFGRIVSPSGNNDKMICCPFIYIPINSMIYSYYYRPTRI